MLILTHMAMEITTPCCVEDLSNKVAILALKYGQKGVFGFKMNVVQRLSGRIFNSYYGYNNGSHRMSILTYDGDYHSLLRRRLA